MGNAQEARLYHLASDKPDEEFWPIGARGQTPSSSGTGFRVV